MIASDPWSCVPLILLKASMLGLIPEHSCTRMKGLKP